MCDAVNLLLLFSRRLTALGTTSPVETRQDVISVWLRVQVSDLSKDTGTATAQKTLSLDRWDLWVFGNTDGRYKD